MLWAYLAFSQFLIIWAGNLPEEIPWYLERIARRRGGTSRCSLVFGHFALPFALLLSRDLKKQPALLAKVAIGILAMRLVDLIWLVAPNFEHGTASRFTGWTSRSRSGWRASGCSCSCAAAQPAAAAAQRSVLQGGVRA